MDTSEDTLAIIASDYTKTKHAGIKAHKNGATYLFDIRIDGKRYRKVWESNQIHGKADRLKIAYSKCEEFHTDVLHRNTITANPDATVEDYWLKIQASSTWKAYLIKEYDNYFKKNLYKLANIKLKDLKSSHFTDFNITLNHLSTRSKRKAYEILQPIIALAIEDEIIFKSPIKKSHIPKRKSLEEKKIITNAQNKYRAVHEAIYSIYKNEPVYRAAFLLMFHGRRVSETLKLQWEDVDFTNNNYTVRGHTSKVNIDMTFALPADVKDALLEFQDVKGDVFPFCSLNKEYVKIRKFTGIQEFTGHWMRNLSVSALASMGVEITHLSAMLGHTDGGTIRKYLSLQREESTTVTDEASKRLLL